MKSHATAVPASCVAGVTVYRPDERVLRRLLDVLRLDGVPTFVHVDGPTGEAIEATLLAKLQTDPNTIVSQADCNSGIGAALNALAARATSACYSRILLLDQDSDVTEGLCRELNEAFDELESNGRRIAAIGPQPVPPPNEASKPPRYHSRARGADWSASSFAVDYIITSGSLVSLDVWRDIGPFRADYFIDAIDTEWSLRAWDQRYEIHVVPAIRLPHRIGNGIVRFGPLAFPRQSEKRMLSYVRNQVNMLRLAHVPKRRKLRTFAYLPFQLLAFLTSEPTARGATGRFAKAARDGWKGRLGPL